MRAGKRLQTVYAFPLCSLLIIAALSWPRIDGRFHLWQNGLYECFCIILLFPLIVAMGAGSNAGGKVSERSC